MTIGRLRLALGPLLALAWLLAAGRALAQPTPGSVAFVDVTVDGARLEQDVPVEELERALRRPLARAGDAPEETVRNIGRSASSGVIWSM